MAQVIVHGLTLLTAECHPSKLIGPYIGDMTVDVVVYVYCAMYVAVVNGGLDS